ncbi:MAG: hypothetical protein NC517_06540 [Firmicutes bacterium]|nr:hypothetical protein [Bacillota bacterium]
MAKNIIPDFSREKREYFRRECNFTPREEQLFDLRNQEYSLEECAVIMNCSDSTVSRISKRMLCKIKEQI